MKYLFYLLLVQISTNNIRCSAGNKEWVLLPDTLDQFDHNYTETELEFKAALEVSKVELSSTYDNTMADREYDNARMSKLLYECKINNIKVKFENAKIEFEAAQVKFKDLKSTLQTELETAKVKFEAELKAKEEKNSKIEFEVAREVENARSKHAVALEEAESKLESSLMGVKVDELDAALECATLRARTDPEMEAINKKISELESVRMNKEYSN